MRAILLLKLAITFGAAVSSFGQGGLTPPGAPAPTMKTLDELDAKLERRTAITNLPMTIFSAGSYYLATNLTGVSGLNGIEIFAHDVTIDLNGFSLIGVTNTARGVWIGGGIQNAVVRNGSISGWGADGVGTLDNASTVRLENLRVRNCGNVGIKVFGKGQITDCAARGNSSHGIQAGDVCLVTRCEATANGTSGIVTGVECRVSDCLAQGNGSDGINAGFRTSIRNCTATGNTTDGIRALAECDVRNNVCAGNGNGGDGAGIHATGIRNRIEENQVLDNDRGIDVDSSGNLVVRNSASGNTTNYDIHSGSGSGPIVTAGGDLSIPTNGNHPWANFAH
jgi:parallel beta-helix repeat protein